MFRSKREAAPERQSGLMNDIERMLRRVKMIPLAAPLLLFGGWGLGKTTTERVALPEDTSVRVAYERPRIEIEALGSLMERIRSDGDRTVSYVSLYADHVEPVEKVLRKRGVSSSTARQIAWPLVENSYRRGLDLSMVVSVMLVESEGKPTATSPVGARGLMQVMPLWAGDMRSCPGKTASDLYNIGTNLCYGTGILAWYMDRFDGDTRRALLGYNGCVRGTNTPDCKRYPDKIYRLSAQIRRELKSKPFQPLPSSAAD